MSAASFLLAAPVKRAKLGNNMLVDLFRIELFDDRAIDIHLRERIAVSNNMYVK